MIRDVGKTIKINKLMVVEEIITKEKISDINISPETKTLEVTIDLINNDNQIAKKEIVVFNQEKYDLLYSLNEIFEEGKQEETYRETDLWKVIDLIQSEKSSA